MRRVQSWGPGAGPSVFAGRAGTAVLAMAAMGLALAGAARAAVEATTPDGRRVLLEDNGTWRYADTPAAAEPAAGDGAAAQPAKPPAQAELFLQARADEPAGCRFELGMVNTLGYEIRMLTPEFTVYRDTGVAYSARTVDFGPLRPGDRNLRRVLFGGIACGEIAALRVGGGDRCVMGELTKFSDVKGECLARIRLRPSELLTFEKEPQ